MQVYAPQQVAAPRFARGRTGTAVAAAAISKAAFVRGYPEGLTLATRQGAEALMIAFDPDHPADLKLYKTPGLADLETNL